MNDATIDVGKGSLWMVYQQPWYFVDKAVMYHREKKLQRFISVYSCT